MAAKKAPAKKVEVAPQQKEVAKAAPKVEPTKPSWEIKDRMYIVVGASAFNTYNFIKTHSKASFVVL